MLKAVILTKICFGLTIMRAEKSPYAFADVVDWVRPDESLSVELAAVDAKRATIMSAIDAARSRTAEARVETSRLKQSIVDMSAPVSARDAKDAAVREAAADSQRVLTEAAAARGRAAALKLARTADVAEALRVARTDLAQAEEDATAAVDALAALKQEPDPVSKAQVEAKRALAAVQATATIVADYKVKPPYAVAVAALAGLLFSDALNLDKTDLLCGALCAGLMLVLLPTDDSSPAA